MAVENPPELAAWCIQVLAQCHQLQIQRHLVHTKNFGGYNPYFFGVCEGTWIHGVHQPRSQRSEVNWSQFRFQPSSEHCSVVAFATTTREIGLPEEYHKRVRIDLFRILWELSKGKKNWKAANIRKIILVNFDKKPLLDFEQLFGKLGDGSVLAIGLAICSKFFITSFQLDLKRPPAPKVANFDQNHDDAGVLIFPIPNMIGMSWVCLYAWWAHTPWQVKDRAVDIVLEGWRVLMVMLQGPKFALRLHVPPILRKCFLATPLEPDYPSIYGDPHPKKKQQYIWVSVGTVTEMALSLNTGLESCLQFHDLPEVGPVALHADIHGSKLHSLALDVDLGCHSWTRAIHQIPPNMCSICGGNQKHAYIYL